MIISGSVFAETLPPLKKVNLPKEISDDLHFENLLTAIARQLKSFEQLDLDKKIKFGNRVVRREHLKESLIEFRKLVVDTLNCFEISTPDVCYGEFQKSFEEHFEAYRPIPKASERGYHTNQSTFTGYYSPDLEGSYSQTDKYKNPIYAMPNDADLRNLSSDDINYGGKLNGHELELFYVSASLFDIWMLHVEGGGRVKVLEKDGSIKYYYLSYAGTNEQKFNMLATYMVTQGMLSKGNTGVEAQRKYFDTHPKKQREILASCPSYVYFKISKTEPLGVNNIPLTPGRSLATDYRIYKEYGMINFIKTKKPILRDGKISKISFSRFFLNQDTGGAIKGRARSDLYFGYGRAAEVAANNLYDLGEQYFIILK